MSVFRGMVRTILGDSRISSRPARPPGLGGYMLVRTGDIRLDKRQRGGVPTFHAHLIDRNKYHPRTASRPKEMRSWHETR